mmetsp:Transcript_25994/g.32052  ORF Transcript_25994/g.32052 Transcript_25994/m.32052 type:complete len:220 (+) Transcript_25994:242-901(+)
MPLNPIVAASKTEIPTRGIIAMSTNGVPAYNALEGGSTNAVEPDASSFIQDAKFWYGHADRRNAWHFHNPHLGKESPSSDELIGYALDGFPIYGPLSDTSGIDACNGIQTNGQYQYHVQTIEQVDAALEYCNGNSPETNWNYVLGCYSGALDETDITNSDTYQIPEDCVLDNTESEENTEIEPPYSPTPTSSARNLTVNEKLMKVIGIPMILLSILNTL